MGRSSYTKPIDGRSSCYIFVDGHENMVVLLGCKLQDHKDMWQYSHLPGACHCKCVALLVRGLSKSDMLVIGSCLASFLDQ